MEQCGHAISYLSYDSLKRREEKKRKKEREMAPIHEGIGTQGNECYFVPVLRQLCDGMVFHSLTNQTFRGSETERSSWRKIRWIVNNMGGILRGGNTYPGIAMEQVKSELRGTEREKKESFRPCVDSLEPAEKARPHWNH